MHRTGPTKAGLHHTVLVPMCSTDKAAYDEYYSEYVTEYLTLNRLNTPDACERQ